MSPCAVSSILHAGGLTAVAFATASFLIGNGHMLLQTMVTAGLILMSTSWILSGFGKRAVVCRTFHSRQVEDVLITRVLGQVSWFCKIVLIENKRFPEFERRYDVAATVGMLLAAVVLSAIYWMETESLFFGALLPAGISVCAVDRSYFALSWLRDRIRRNHIASDDALAQWLKELARPSWRLVPRYIRTCPFVFHTVTADDDHWYPAIVYAMMKANLILFNVTHIAESEGLLKEFRTVVRLMDTEEIDPSRVVMVCDYSCVDSVRSVIERYSGRYEISLIPVGGPANQGEEWKQLFARAAPPNMALQGTRRKRRAPELRR
jgi:hypothetical protein